MEEAEDTLITSECSYTHEPNEVLPDITETECENLGASAGLDGAQRGNCDDLLGLLCDIRQGIDAVNVNQAITIAPNDASKCRDDNLPTLASQWSRILRFAQAVVCILCNYDPRISTILKMGRYPQILMGSQQDGGYPQWVNPDDIPTEGSEKPVTSAGVYDAIEEAIMSVWHLWKEQPEFDYFAQTLDSASDPYDLMTQMEKWPAEEGNTALVATSDGKTSLLYTYTGGKWVFTRELTNEQDNLTNFATTHINKGYYATNGVYYFDGTWQVMDVDMGELDKRVEELEAIFKKVVVSGDADVNYTLTTRPTLEEAEKVECIPGRETIVLVTG